MHLGIAVYAQASIKRPLWSIKEATDESKPNTELNQFKTILQKITTEEDLSPKVVLLHAEFTSEAEIVHLNFEFQCQISTVKLYINIQFFNMYSAGT